MAIQTLCPDSVRLAVHFFVNFDIFKWLYLLGLFCTKFGELENLVCALFMTMWISSFPSHNLQTNT